MTVTWDSRLKTASSEQDVLIVVRDFIATWTPLEMASLPTDCRPWKMIEANDVTGFALHLAQRKWHGDSDHGFVLARMRAFFANASSRLSGILAAPNEPSDSAIEDVLGQKLN